MDTARIDIRYKEVVEVFQSLFLGANNDGLIVRETWTPRAGLLEGFSRNHSLGIFTGRTHPEIDFTLARFAPDVRWSAIIADAEVPNPKPAPDGLRAIEAAHPESVLTYVGDNVDDARSAQAATVGFIGGANGDEDLAKLLRNDGAIAVIPSVNHLESVL